MFRSISKGARSVMPNVDGWDVLLWLSIAVGFYGIANLFSFYVACIALAVVGVTFGYLGSSAPKPAKPPES